jgi:hypothetical protein
MTTGQMAMLLEGNECNQQAWGEIFDTEPNFFADSIKDVIGDEK